MSAQLIERAMQNAGRIRLRKVHDSRRRAPHHITDPNFDRAPECQSASQINGATGFAELHKHAGLRGDSSLIC